MNWLDVERSRPPLRETEDRLFIEDRRQARAAWEAHDAEKQRRLAELDRHPIARLDVWESALTTLWRVLLVCTAWIIATALAVLVLA